ncbi:MAG: serine hydrolase domain-containing protein [Bacteroidota bacterium]
MKKIILFIVGLTMINCSGQPKEAVADKAVPAVKKILQENAASFLSDPKINAVSIGVYKDGKTYTQHLGELDKGKKNTPTDATIYEIASVSKSFAGILVAQAVVDKKLTVEEDIRKYLDAPYPNLAFGEKPIRIKHLLTHTAGLPRFFPTTINDLFSVIDETLPFRINEIEKQYNKAAFLNDLASIDLEVEPGTSYAYANANVELIAHILENIYAMPYEQLLQKYICKKAGMKDTKVQLSGKDTLRLANGYGETNQLVPHFANPLWGAGSGIKSTIPDLLNYIRFQLEAQNEVVKTSKKLLYSNPNIQMAYLWPMFNNPEDGTFYTIHGGAFGTQNFLMIAPKYDLGISIITNQSGPETQEKLSNLLDNLFSELTWE